MAPPCILSRMIESWIPATLSPAIAGGLILAAALTSMITAALGAGGGVVLLALLALTLPAGAIIPVHGLVQLGSNAGRALMMWRHIDLRTIAAFAPGVVLGAWLASRLLVGLPLATIQIAIAGFILLLVWGPPVPRRALGATGTFLASTATSFLSLFVGATGPLVAAFIKQQQASHRLTTVATFAAAMTLQHAPKAVVFGFAGFAFRDWIGLIGVMIIAGAIGTWVGIHLLRRFSDQRFHRVFQVLLTLLALRLAWQALWG